MDRAITAAHAQLGVQLRFPAIFPEASRDPGTSPGVTGGCRLQPCCDPRTRALQSSAWRSAASELQFDHAPGAMKVEPAPPLHRVGHSNRSAAYGDRSAGRSAPAWRRAPPCQERSAREPRSSRASSREDPRSSLAPAANPTCSPAAATLDNVVTAPRPAPVAARDPGKAAMSRAALLTAPIVPTLLKLALPT